MAIRAPWRPGRAKWTGEDRGAGRNHTDDTRNTDKPYSVFHISHHLVSFIQAHEIYLIVTQETGAEKGSVNAKWTA